VFGAFSAESGNDGNDLNENRPSHGGESWGRHSMRIGGDRACINSRSCFPFLGGPASARYRFKLYPRRDCAVSFAVILPMGIAVEHANSAPVVPGASALFGGEFAADILQRPRAGAVSVEGRIYGSVDQAERVGAAERGDLPTTPTPPTAWLLKASAADLIQRPSVSVVSIK
jgi:hypothetical protein